MPLNTNPEAIIGVVGAGRVGSHAARQLPSTTAVGVFDTDRRTRTTVVDMLGSRARAVEPNGAPATTVIVATPAASQLEIIGPLVTSGVSVVSTCDDPAVVRGLLDLHEAAADSGAVVVAGAGMSPGISCLFAAHLARRFDRVDEVSVWTTGTGGPACARRHHRALQQPGPNLIEGRWIDRRGGGGRDLAWFPDQLGAQDCYRGALAEPVLLHRLIPSAHRISARTAANRRARLTSRLPMLRRPHRDGGPGGFRIELRGIAADGRGYLTEVAGLMVYPSVGSGALAALVATALHTGRATPGAWGTAELGLTGFLLTALHDRGVRAAKFEGVT